MITSIIQVLAIALLFYALYRETKRDRLNELRKRKELQDLFRAQQSFISKSILEPLRAISVDEVQYVERQKQILKTIDSLCRSVDHANDITVDTRNCTSEIKGLLKQIRDFITGVNSNTAKLPDIISAIIKDYHYNTCDQISQISIQLRDIPSIKSIVEATSCRLENIQSIESIVEATSCRLENIPSIESIESIQSIVEATSCRLENIQPTLYEIQNELKEQTYEFLPLKPLIQDLIETRKQNLIKDGEANRTLRRRLQEKDTVLASTRQSLKAQEMKITELTSQNSEVRSAASEALGYLLEEISAIRSWMEERGIPATPLDKHLSLHFKGKVPSGVCKQLQNEEQLMSALGETISHLQTAAQNIPSDQPDAVNV